MNCFRRIRFPQFIAVLAFFMLLTGLTAVSITAVSATSQQGYEAISDLPQSEQTLMPGSPVYVRFDPRENRYYVPATAPIQDRSQRKGARITVDFLEAGELDSNDRVCESWPDEARSAYAFAVDIWEWYVYTPVPIVIQACYTDLSDLGDEDGQVLGYGGAGHVANIGGAWYAISLANALVDRDINGVEPEIINTFNSRIPWHFGNTGPAPADKVDFVTVALHETTHGLGFAGTMNWDDGIVADKNPQECDGTQGSGCWGFDSPIIPGIFDRFTEDANATSLINTSVYTNPSQTLGNALTSSDVYFNGQHANRANGNRRVKLFAPVEWVPGSSYAHLDYDTYLNTPNALMIYSLPSGTAIHDPGQVTLGILMDLGWTLTSLPNPPAEPAEVISAGGNHTCALTPSGFVDCWGDDSRGQGKDQRGPMAQVSGGLRHTCALTPERAAVCWGANGNGQAADQNGPYTQVSAGGFHTCALTPSGTIDCWGANGYGQATNQIGPYTQVTAGDYHTCALTPSGAVDCWGYNVFSQAEHKAGPYVQVTAGQAHTCALNPSGGVECWGSNGQGRANGQPGPYSQVSAGGAHTCAIARSGAVDCWGKNDADQASDVIGSFVQVSAGRDHTCALTPDGTVECWGKSSSHQTASPTGLFGPYVPCPTIPGNLVANSCFDHGTEPWRLPRGGRYAPALYLLSTADPFAGPSSAMIRVWGPLPPFLFRYRVQFYQPGLRLEPNTTYELSFAAKSDKARDLTVSTDYGLNRYWVDLGPQWKRFSTTFTTPNLPESQITRLRFDLRRVPTGTVLKIDNVVLVPVE